MEASPFEKNLSGGTVRASAHVSNLPSKEEAASLLQEISSTYPNLNERFEDGKIYSDSKPVITESEVCFEDNGKNENRLDCALMTKVMSSFFSSNNVELFLIKIQRSDSANTDKNEGVVLLSLSHAICDGALVAQILGDFVSLLLLKQTNSPTDSYKRGIIEHKPQLEVVKDLKSNLQTSEEFEKERKYDLITIPPPLKENADPTSGELYYKGICINFDISKIIDVCHSIKVRPQAFFTVADIFSICGTVNEISSIQNYPNDPSKPFSIVSQISVNTRKQVHISPLSPACYAAPVYIMSNIDNDTNGRSLMLHVQQEINQKVEKFAVPHLKAYCEGKFPPVVNQSWASNVGIVESEVPVWVQGGAYKIPDAARAARGFTSHVITTKSKVNQNSFPSEKAGCIVMTFLSPTCDDEFVSAMTKRFKWFLDNPQKAIDVKILGGKIPDSSIR